MPTWIARTAAPWIWRRVSWKTVWTVTLWLAQKGRDRVRANLDEDEQWEFWRLLKKSRGRASNLTPGDRARVRIIVGKAIRG
ncbi:MAG TPA: hypothetical protein VHA76_03525 [Solirubrobacterales bacterium]|nr:hypothetical protein [Solirubrobacterales bacterium]